jgi:hypothetical protein
VNDLTGAMTMAVGQAQTCGFIYDGILDCNVNEALNLVLSGAQQVSGFINYALVNG